ncbi:MAG: molybdenum cofactor guanylyltransferase [Saprospiraceae bacterium]
MPQPNPKIAVLLVGGHSTRMGSDKFAMDINGRPQWEFMLGELKSFFDEVHIACRRDQAHHFAEQRLIFDELADIGPMGAIHAAFRQLGSTSPLFFIACDLPNFNSGLSAKLHSELSAEYDVVAAYNAERESPEPLVAFWSPSALPLIEKFIARENYALFKCMSQLKVKSVEIKDSTSLRNVNSLQDL